QLKGLAPVSAKPQSLLAAEERENVLARLVGNAERLDAELLLDLEGLQPGRFLVHVSIDELRNARRDRVPQSGNEVRLQIDALLVGAEAGRSLGHFLERCVCAGDVAVERRLVGR